MNDLNQISIIGRVTRDAELKYSASGTAIANFAIAVNRSVKKGDQWVDEASFFDLAVFAKTAENLSKYLVKGTQVAVTGSLVQDRWEKDGVKQSKVKISVDQIQLIGNKHEGGGSREGSAPAPREEKYQDDVPF